MHYSTYRKSMCMYDYLPFSSCHDRNCKLGIFKGELFRLLKTNLQEADFLKQSEFTFRKLIERGYDRIALRKIKSEFTWQSKQERLAPKGVEAFHKQILPFKLQFSDSFRRVGIGRILTEQCSILPESFSSRHKIVVCFTSNKNLFRLRYFRFL